MNFENRIVLTNDKPIEIGGDIFEHDTLNYKASVEGLTSLITCTQKPYTMGVFGDWGSGKTSFMRMLKARLEEKNYATYWFDAWKYESQNDLIVPLLHGLSKQFRRVSSNIREKLCKSASVIGLSFADIFLRTSTAGACTSDDIKKNLELYEEMSSEFYKYHSDQVIRLEDAFKDCIKGARETEQKNSVVIFIDDLDRCMPENVIGLLEKIKNYLALENCQVVFVIGVDKAMLEKSVMARYGSELIEADRYLEKIINLSADIPVNNVDIEKFIKTEFKYHFLSPNQEEENLENMFIEIVKDSKINNPRKLKRLITRYLFYIVLRKSYAVHPQVMIYLLICKEYYPTVYQAKKNVHDVFDWPLDCKEKLTLSPSYFQNKGIKFQNKDYPLYFEATDFIYSLTF